MAYGRITKTLYEKRKDLYSGKDERPIPISIYYPTEEEGNSLYEELYSPKEEMLKKIYSDGNEEKIDYLKTVEFPFINNAKPLEVIGKRNLVIISHGLTADRDFFQFLIYKILDAGFYVITVGHVYDTDFTLIPDTNEVIEMKENLLALSKESDRAWQLRERAKDIDFVISKLKEINDLPEIKNSMIEEDISVVGHSMGGMTSLIAGENEKVKSIVLLDGSIQFLHEVYKDREDILEAYKNKNILNFRRGFISYEEKLKYKIEKLKELDSKKFKNYILKEHDERVKDLDSTLELFKRFSCDNEYFIYQAETHHLSFCDYFLMYPEKYDYEVPLNDIHETMGNVVRDFLVDSIIAQDGSFKEKLRNNTYQGIHMQNFEYLENERKQLDEYIKEV